MVICLEQGATDFHMIQLLPLLPHHSLLHKNPDWFNLSGAGLPGCPGKQAVKQMSVCYGPLYNYFWYFSVHVFCILHTTGTASYTDDL